MNTLLKTKLKLLKAILVVCVVMLSTGSLAAQNVSVSGTVTDKNGEPLIGVSVVEKGTQNGVATDFDGKYYLKVASNGTLNFSLVGLKTSTVAVSGQSIINCVMEEDAVLLDDVVVVGFGTQKKENLTGAVSIVDVDKTFANRPTGDVAKSLQGAVPGLTLSYTTGDQGASPTIKIRGTGSINGTGEPLILLDGVEISDLSFVNPDNIQSISVLKDAASTSIYGSRAAFGVVLIQSKDGSKQKNKVTVNYSANFALSQPIGLPDYCEGYEVIDQLYEGILAQYNTDGSDIEAFGMYYKDLIEPMTEWLDNYYGQDLGNVMVYGRDYDYNSSGTAQFYRTWDPNEELFKSATFSQTHNVSVAGNSGNTNYNLGLGYYYSEGVLKEAESQYIERFNTNISTNTQITDWLNVGTKVMYTEKYQEYPTGYSTSSGYNLYYYNMRFPTFFPYGISDGAYDSSTGTYLNSTTESGEGLYFRHGNSYVAYQPTSSTKDEYIRLTGNLKADITKNLSFYGDYTRGVQSTLYNTIQQPQYTANWWSSYSPAAATVTSDYLSNTWVKQISNAYNAYFDYNFNLNRDHDFAAKLGMNAEDLTYNSNYIYTTGVINADIPTLGQTSGASSATVSENLASRSTAGFFGRINYNYKGKYLAEVNGRYDGSSQFAVGEKWAFFPSASLGYRITEETFMEPTRDILNDLKLRASYGSIGNQDIDETSLAWYPYISTLTQYNASWVNGDGTLASTVTMPAVVGEFMTWETINTLDLGFDVVLYKDFSAGFDWYQRKNSGMLVPRNEVSSIGGYSSLPDENSGTLTTNGWEVSINYNHSFNKDFYVYATATISDSKSTITEWNESTGLLTGYYEGMELGEIWGFRTSDGNGYFSADEVANGVQTAVGTVSIADYQGNLQVGSFVYGEGDVKYTDLDGDGNINSGSGTIDDHGDLERIGNSLPRYEYSFRVGGGYKGFDLDIYFQGVGKRDLWTTSSLWLPHTASAQMNIFSYQLDYYTEDNQDAFYPRPYIGHTGSTVSGLTTYTGNNNFYPQTKYLLNMAYLRLKNVTVGYTLPENLSKKAKLNKVRFYVSGENLLTFDNINGIMDPEATGGSTTVTSDDTSYTGRTTPLNRTWSFGVQITI